MQTPKEEMMQLISTCIENQDFQTARECLKIYSNSFGADEFFDSCTLSLLNDNGPRVSLICLDVSASTLEDYLAVEPYKNLEIIDFVGKDYINDLTTYLKTCSSKYLCFLEENQRYEASRIASMVRHLEQIPTLNAVVCTRNHIDSDGEIIAHPDYAYEDTLENKILDGKLLLEYSIHANVNLYGTPSTLVLSVAYAQGLLLSDAHVTPDICAMSLLYQLLLPACIGYLHTPYVSTFLENYRDTSETQLHYEAYIRFLSDNGQLSCNTPAHVSTTSPAPLKEPLARDITFISGTCGGEFFNIKPIAEEASRRGFHVHFTEDRYAKAEIGIYSQHICHPENSKFSVILLHDMAQGSDSWPNLWEVERWNNFDIGILPGRSWAERWTDCSCFYYTHPRSGVYELGYPMSDTIHGEELQKRASELRRELGLKYDYTILYAPSWENDGKEDDFIQALSSLKVNLIIKQACWNFLPEIQANVEEMRKLHEFHYDNVYYIEQEESIMTAIALCDLLVSEESSVMAEAILLNKPSIAVTDWLIPDKTPSRKASVPMDYVIKCHKAELRDTVDAVISHEIPCEEYIKRGWRTFSNAGNCCKDIVDAIEYFTQGADFVSTGDVPDFLSKQVTASRYTRCTMWN